MTGAKKGARTAPAFVVFEDLPGAVLLGARARVSTLEAFLDGVSEIEQATATTIHVVDAAAVCGPAHLASALLHARRAHDRGRARARERKVETMLYLTGRRQISVALEIAGLSTNTRGLGLAIEGAAPAASKAAELLAAKLGATRDDRVLAPSQKKLARLGLRSGGKADLEALALEAVAMLDME